MAMVPAYVFVFITFPLCREFNVVLLFKCCLYSKKAREPLRLKRLLPSLDAINVSHLGGGIFGDFASIVRPIRRHNHGVSVCLGVSWGVTVCRGVSW